MSGSEPDDRWLLARARAGDDEAFDALARRWRPYVLAICRSYLAAEDANDATQTALIRFLAHLDSINPVQPMAPYVAAIARNTCRELLRSNARRKLSTPSTGCPCGLEQRAEVEQAAGAACDPAVGALAADVGEHLEHCLHALQPRSRLLIELHYLAGIPRDRLHEYWPASLPSWRIKQTLSNWLKRALASLRACLEARGVDAAAAAEFLDWSRDEPYSR